MNEIMVIRPYYDMGCWMFDDPAVGLEGEPFVGQVNIVLDYLTQHIPNARSGCRMLFSHAPFPNSHRMVRVREENEGSWYYSPELDIQGWLCKAMFRYFETAPDELYVTAEPLNESGS